MKFRSLQRRYQSVRTLVARLRSGIVATMLNVWACSSLRVFKAGRQLSSEVVTFDDVFECCICSLVRCPI